METQQLDKNDLARIIVLQQRDQCSAHRSCARMILTCRRNIRVRIRNWIRSNCSEALTRQPGGFRPLICNNAHCGP